MHEVIFIEDGDEEQFFLQILYVFVVKNRVLKSLEKKQCFKIFGRSNFLKLMYTVDSHGELKSVRFMGISNYRDFELQMFELQWKALLRRIKNLFNLLRIYRGSSYRESSAVVVIPLTCTCFFYSVTTKSNNWRQFESPQRLAVNKWNHIVISYRKPTLTFYIDTRVRIQFLVSFFFCKNNFQSLEFGNCTAQTTQNGNRKPLL